MSIPPPAIAGRKRRTEEPDRCDNRASHKYAKGLESTWVAPSVPRQGGPYGASTSNEGNALAIYTSTSNTADSEEEVSEDDLVPESVLVLRQGPSKSQSTSSEEVDNGRANQTPFETAKYKCFSCWQGFGRVNERDRHFRSDRHFRLLEEAAAREGRKLEPRPEKRWVCTEVGCERRFGRKDALQRHQKRHL